MEASARQWYRFGPFQLCESEGILLRDGQSQAVSPRTFDTLAFLVKKSPNLVTTEELIAGVWANLRVEPSNVTQHVFAVRKVLGDNSQSPTYIQNVPRRGYRFIAPVEQYEEETKSASAHIEVVPPASAPPVANEGTLTTRRTGRRSKTVWLLCVAAAAAVLVAGPLIAFLPVAPPEIRIKGYRQLTHDGGQKEGPLLLDGKQIIYRSTEGAGRMWAIPIQGGEAIPIGSPGDVEADVSPDGRSLLFSSTDATGVTLYSRVLAGGQPQSLMEADGASWAPDGKRLAVANAGTLSLLNGNTLVASVSVLGQAANPRWSPDGQRIRFTILKPNEAALWEIHADGSALRQLKESSASSVVRDGVWNSDGSLFFFTAHANGAENIWAARERKLGMLREESNPVAVTNGPGDWRWPIAAADNKQFFAIHSVAEPQLTSLEKTTGEWRPFWHGAPVYEMDFSRDRRWVAFIQFPDHTLWKARTDGSERVQLTQADLEAHEPHWSPDGKRVAFMSRAKDKEWRVRIVSANGGPPEVAAPSPKGQGVPTWLADGRAIIFGDRTETRPGPRMNIHYLDLTTHHFSDIANSYGLWSPRWSPDGKYIAAPSFDGTNLALMKWPVGEWKNVLRMRSIKDVNWSADSRYLYFRGQKEVDCSELYRYQIAGNKLEMLASLNDFRWPAENWFGVTPDGALLALYESSPQEVFAIDYELH